MSTRSIYKINALELSAWYLKSQTWHQEFSTTQIKYENRAEKNLHIQSTFWRQKKYSFCHFLPFFCCHDSLRQKYEKTLISLSMNFHYDYFLWALIFVYHDITLEPRLCYYINFSSSLPPGRSYRLWKAFLYFTQIGFDEKRTTNSPHSYNALQSSCLHEALRSKGTDYGSLTKHVKQKQFLTYEMGLLYFFKHKYPAAVDQATRKKKKKKTTKEENNYLLFSNLHLQASSIYLLGQMAQAHWSHTFLVSLMSHLPPSFSEQHQTPLTVPAPLSEHFTVCGEDNLTPERGKPGGSAHSCALAQELPHSPELLCTRSSGSSHFGQCSSQTLLHSVQLKVIWQPQFVLYWLNICRQTIQYQFKAKPIKTWCCWQMQISPCRSEPCCIISVTEALYSLQ